MGIEKLLCLQHKNKTLFDIYTGRFTNKTLKLNQMLIGYINIT